MLLGISLTLAYAPFSFWLILPVSLSLFLWHLQQSNSPFKTGFAFGFGWFGAGVSWVHVSIADFGGIPLIASLLMMAALAAYLALYPALFAFLSKKYIRSAYWPLAMPVIWLVTEWLRGTLFTGFPWLSIGYSQLESPLSGWIPIIGETGLSALVILICASAAVYIPQKKLMAPAVVTATLLISGVVLNQHQWVTPTEKTAKVSLVQGNIAQEMRWVPEQEQPTMQKYWDMTSAHWESDIVIWPEAAVPKLEPFATDYLLRLDQKALETNTGLITGIVNYNLDTREAFNTMLGLGLRHDDSTQPQYRYQHNNRYVKNHLVPLGEFVPFESAIRELAPIFDLPMSSFTRGDYQQANLIVKGMPIVSALCYEIIFPQQIRANINNKTQFIVTLSNDAWFGRSHGPAQHLQIAQMRAKEFGLPVLRATNNGYTAIVNESGHIQSQIPQFKSAVLTDNVSLVSGSTPYRHFGDLWSWLTTILALAWALYSQRKHSEP
jgi:apolipoprotein N-acyltransferase